MSDDSIEKIARSIFLRKGDETFQTKVFSNLKDNKKQLVFNLARKYIDEEEKIILYREVNQGNYFLRQFFTTRRILELNDSNINNFLFTKEIVLSSLIDTLIHQRQNGISKKNDLSMLVFYKKSGEETIIKIEKGKSYTGIRYMIEYVLSKN